MGDDPGFLPRKRLWTPWRMAYVGGGSPKPGCVFCNALASDDDAGSLIVHRGEDAFVILNLYPYNTGHLMVVPNTHTDQLAALTPETRAEMAELTASYCTKLLFVTGCDGLNTGMNLGAAAGAGIADHLHQHIVPRWTGDANFMPIVGGTRVLPELIPATYAKIRAEACRQASGTATSYAVLFDADGAGVFLDGSRLPLVHLDENLPVWTSMVAGIGGASRRCEILGWAGPSSTANDASGLPAVAISYTPRADDDSPYRLVSFEEARSILPEAVAAVVRETGSRLDLDVSGL